MPAIKKAFENVVSELNASQRQLGRADEFRAGELLEDRTSGGLVLNLRSKSRMPASPQSIRRIKQLFLLHLHSQGVEHPDENIVAGDRIVVRASAFRKHPHVWIWRIGD